MIESDFYKLLENEFNVIYPGNNNATYSSLLNFSSEKDTFRQRWYIYKEGYSSQLVEKIIKDYNKYTDAIILDPFLGSGSTIMAANKLPLNNKVNNKVEDPISYLINEIKLHCESKNFSKNNLNKLKVIASITGNDKSNDKQLRGAYLEYYFYKLLLELKRQNIIDDIIWNGKKGKYGLPVQAPGGRIGTPDIIFTIDNVDFVLELTTIKAKAQQFSAEASSVPDHIQLYNQRTDQRVKGIFSAPQMHERNIMTMRSALKSYGLDIICLTIDDLLEIFETKNRKIIFETLMEN